MPCDSASLCRRLRNLANDPKPQCRVVSNNPMRLVLVILAACDAGQKPAPIAKHEPQSEVRIPEKKKHCASADEAAEKQGAIDAADRASYEAALAAKGLTALPPLRVQEVVGERLRD